MAEFPFQAISIDSDAFILRVVILLFGTNLQRVQQATCRSELQKFNKRKREMKKIYDALIIGGGPAGLSAALALRRMMRSALVCDDGRPRNVASAHANNLPSQDGINPFQWRSQARRDLKKYETIEFFEGSVQSVSEVENKFTATLSTGEQHCSAHN